MTFGDALNKLLPVKQVQAIVQPYLQQAQQVVQKAGQTVTRNITGNLPTPQQAISNVTARVTQPKPQTYTITPSVTALKQPQQQAVAQPTQNFAQVSAASTQRQQQQQQALPKATYATAGGNVPKASDINPETGLPYAINPVSGQWDDAYYNTVIRRWIEQAGVPQNVVNLVQKYAPSRIDYEAIKKQTFEEMKPYYERLLSEANWDYNTAVKNLRADYDLGLRGERTTADISRKSQLASMTPEAQQTAEDLNRRGLLGTVQGEAQPVTTTLSTGETATARSPFVKSYGGLAGTRIGELVSGQKARLEAIDKALKQRESEMSQNLAQQEEVKAEQKKRQIAGLQQQRAEETAKLASQKYGEQQQQAQLKVSGLLEPYNV